MFKKFDTYCKHYPLPFTHPYPFLDMVMFFFRTFFHNLHEGFSEGDEQAGGRRDDGALARDRTAQLPVDGRGARGITVPYTTQTVLHIQVTQCPTQPRQSFTYRYHSALYNPHSPSPTGITVPYTTQTVLHLDLQVSQCPIQPTQSFTYR